MIYEYALTVPGNTLSSLPVRLDMPVGPGILHKLEVEFPFGCNKQVAVVVRRADLQVYPTNKDGAMRANGYTVSAPEYFPIEDEPLAFQAYGWSPGTTYAHVITFRLFILPREVLEPGRDAITFLGKLRNLLFRGG